MSMHYPCEINPRESGWVGGVGVARCRINPLTYHKDTEAEDVLIEKMVLSNLLPRVKSLYVTVPLIHILYLVGGGHFQVCETHEEV